MATQSVSIKYRRGDPRQSVTFVEREFSGWPITLHYVLVQTGGGVTDFFNVGLEIGKFENKPGEPIALARRRIPPAVIKHVMGNYPAYDRRGREKLETGENLEGPPVALSPPPDSSGKRRRRDMTPERLKELAKEFEAYRIVDCSPLVELARDYEVNPSTVSRWIAKARDGGYLPQVDRPGKRGNRHAS